MEQKLKEVKKEQIFQKRDTLEFPDKKTLIGENINERKNGPIWFRWVLLIAGIIVIGVLLYFWLFVK